MDVVRAVAWTTSGDPEEKWCGEVVRNLQAYCEPKEYTIEIPDRGLTRKRRARYPGGFRSRQVAGLEKYGEGSYDTLFYRIVCINSFPANCTLREAYAKSRDFSLQSLLDLDSTRTNEDGIHAMKCVYLG